MKGALGQARPEPLVVRHCVARLGLALTRGVGAALALPYADTDMMQLPSMKSRATSPRQPMLLFSEFSLALPYTEADRDEFRSRADLVYRSWHFGAPHALRAVGRRFSNRPQEDSR